MEKFKEIIYSSYVSTHNKNLYGESSLAKFERNFPALNFHFKRHLPAAKDAAILDIGCGDGGIVYWFTTLGYTNAMGVDISQEQIDNGNRMGIKNLHCGDLIDFLTNSGKKFDFIIARDVIEHFTRNEVFEILALISKSLNPNGRFVMQVPNGQGFFYTSVFYGDYTHEMAYTITSVNQIILNTGFRKSACFPTGPVPHGLVSTIRYNLWRMKVAQLKFWKMVETGNANGIFTQNLIAVIDK
jgi:2-polyprenyl-3-methyl-5-hydroxy-6-metoxy-1,4-benzoquinol methylase